MRTLIQNGLVVTGAGAQQRDVLIEGHRVVAVGAALPGEGAQVLDAAGCLLFPGFIDTHTHFDLDLGNGIITADDFVTGTKAAILGGTTTVLDFATQTREGSLTEALNQWHEKAAGSSCDYGFHMAIARWDEGVSAEIDDMCAKGVTSYKMYMVYDALRVDDGTIYQALKRTRDAGCLIGMHCENYDVLLSMVAEQKAMGNGAKPIAHAWSRPAAVEAEAVNRYLRIAQMANAPAYVVHLSTAAGLEEALRARARGQRVYLETCPQYLLLEESAYEEPDGAKFVMSPPLRDRMDQMALWQGIKANAIDTIGTDHCSFTMAQKALGKEDFSKIPNGCAGVETRAQLLYTYGVKTGRISLSQMADLLSGNAARIFGMAPFKGVIAPGAHADIVVWDPQYEGVITHSALNHNCDNTPFEGMRVEGRVRDVLLRGVPVVENGVLTAPGMGRYVRRRLSGRL